MISGQSSRRSRSNNRILVRKRETFEGPPPVSGPVELIAVEAFKLSGGGTRKLRDLAREELLVEIEDDILLKGKRTCSETMGT